MCQIFRIKIYVFKFHPLTFSINVRTVCHDLAHYMRRPYHQLSLSILQFCLYAVGICLVSPVPPFLFYASLRHIIHRGDITQTMVYLVLPSTTDHVLSYHFYVYKFCAFLSDKTEILSLIHTLYRLPRAMYIVYQLSHLEQQLTT